jgi:hypothetical protein
VTTATLRLLVAAFEDIAAKESIGIGPVIPWNYTSDIEGITDYSERTWHEIWQAILSMPATVLFGIFLLISSWSLLSLLGYHAVIVSVAQTTNEKVRGVYRYGSSVNTADNGCCCNWRDFCCRRLPDSRLPPDFSALVKLEKPRDETTWSGNEFQPHGGDSSSSLSDFNAGV